MANLFTIFDAQTVAVDQRQQDGERECGVVLPHIAAGSKVELQWKKDIKISSSNIYRFTLYVSKPFIFTFYSYKHRRDRKYIKFFLRRTYSLQQLKAVVCYAFSISNYETHICATFHPVSLNIMSHRVHHEKNYWGL